MAEDGERRARAKAIPQDGGVQRVETLKHHEVGLTVENQSEKEEGEDVGEEQDESPVAKFFQGTFPIGEERRQDALKKMQVKAKKFKEKREQQKRKKEAKAHPSSNIQMPKNQGENTKTSVHQELDSADMVRLVRNRTEELLQAAIQHSNLPELEGIFDDAQNTVKALEQSIFSLFPKVGLNFKNKVRTIIWNLKDNLELRTNVLTGVITPKELASMSTEEMASPELRQMREEVAKQGLAERIGSSPIYSRQPTWQYLTDRQLDKVGDL